MVKILLVVRHLDPHEGSEFFSWLSKKKRGREGWCFPFHAQPLKLHPSFLVSVVLLCRTVVAPFDAALVILLIPDSTENPHSWAFVLPSPFLLPGWGSSLAYCNTPSPFLSFTFPSPAVTVQKSTKTLTSLLQNLCLKCSDVFKVIL